MTVAGERATNAQVIKKPAWLLFGERCREELSKGKGTNSGKSEDDQIYRCWLEACRQYEYPGTADASGTYFGGAVGGEITTPLHPGGTGTESAHVAHPL